MTENYSDPEDPTCKYCGEEVKRIVPEGTPYWNCEDHGRLSVDEVLGITPGELPARERAKEDDSGE